MWESVEKKMVMWAASSAVDLDEYQEKEVYRVLAISNVVQYIVGFLILLAGYVVMYVVDHNIGLGLQIAGGVFVLTGSLIAQSLRKKGRVSQDVYSETEYIVAKRRIQKKTLIALAEEIVLMPVILKIVMYNETLIYKVYFGVFFIALFIPTMYFFWLNQINKEY